MERDLKRLTYQEPLAEKIEHAGGLPGVIQKRFI